MHPIDARTLEIFRAVAETGSATRAAERLNSTQPSVTRAIGAFERLCGFLLFERGRYGMTLTEAGSVLLESVERNFAGLNMIQQAIGQLRQGLPGTLRTVAVPVVAEGVLCTILSDFARTHPRVGVNIKSARPEMVVNDILTGEVDLGAIIGSPPQGFDLAVRVIGQRRMKLAVPSDHRLANRERVHFRELHDEAFVLIVQPHNIRLAVDTMMNDFGVRPSVIHEVSTQRTAVEMARRSGAIGFADDEIIESSAGGEVQAIELDPPTAWNINLIYRRDRKHSQVFEAFLTWLRETMPGDDLPRASAR
ncbi:MAG: LysR family transcriptional regulator [Pseudomonadota bacterium]